MSELQYRNRSISQLVSELNSLGEEKVLMVPYHLIAIHQADIPSIKRYRGSHGEEFFLAENNQKKFHYHQVDNFLSEEIVDSILGQLENNFNVTLVLQQSENSFQTVRTLLQSFGEYSQDNSVVSAVQYQVESNQIWDGITKTKLGGWKQFEHPSVYYSGKSLPNKLLQEWSKQSSKHQRFRVMKLRVNLSSKQVHNAQLQMVLLPGQFFEQSVSTMRGKSSMGRKDEWRYGLIRSDLIQILNYLKLNPKNRFEDLSKYFVKKHPLVDVLTNAILCNSVNFIVHCLNQPGEQNESSTRLRNNRLEFYDKLYGMSNLVTTPLASPPFTVVDILPTKNNHKNKAVPHQKDVSPSKAPLPKHASFQKDAPNFKEDMKSPVNFLRLSHTNEKSSAAQELEYCRSLQRKTHKFSIDNLEEEGEESIYEDQKASGFDDQGITPVSHRNNDFSQVDRSLNEHATTLKGGVCNQSEKISMLKSQHAIQISQYHQTIQNLNRKILALTNEKGLEELYTIHERQIMLLELKIQELRQQVSSMARSDQEKDPKSLKNIIRKLTEQIKTIEHKQTNQKVIHGKTTMLEKKIKMLQNNLDEGQKARKLLNLELETITKRLKIRDSELQKIQMSEAERYASDEKFAFKEQQFLKEASSLIKAIRDNRENSGEYLLRKIRNVLGDLTQSRELILECNNFLMELQDHIESRLGEKDAEVVLDCNRFIRKFLIENLSIL